MMKRILHLVSLLAVIAHFASAQTTYGVKAGLHFSRVIETFDGRPLTTGAIDYDKNQVLLRPQLGIWLSTPLADRISLQQELLFTQKVWNYLVFPPGAQRLTFNYLSMPLAVAYHFGRFQLTVGPELTFLLSSYYPEASPLNPSTRKSEFVDNHELGLAFNAGVQYVTERWLLGLRFNRDLNAIPTTTFTDANGEPVLGFDHYHQGMTLWAGYALSR